MLLGLHDLVFAEDRNSMALQQRCRHTRLPPLADSTELPIMNERPAARGASIFEHRYPHTFGLGLLERLLRTIDQGSGDITTLAIQHHREAVQNRKAVRSDDLGRGARHGKSCADLGAEGYGTALPDPPVNDLAFEFRGPATIPYWIAQKTCTDQNFFH